MTALAAPQSVLTANLICLASMLVWAAGLPAADLIIPHMPPFALTAARAAAAAVVLLPLWWLLEGGDAMRRANWLRGIWVGGICMGAASAFLIYAQSRTDAVTVAVVTATMPVLGIALECVTDGRRVTPRLLIGLMLSLFGGMMAYLASIGALRIGLGAAAALASVACYTWGSRATVTQFPDQTPLGRTAVTVVGAMIAALAAALIHAAAGAPSPDWAAIGWRELGGLLVFGTGSLAISQLLWIFAVGRLGIGASSLHMNAVPFYVMIFVFLLGGAWDWTQAAGAAVVVLGVLIAQGLIFRPA
ncbi:MAG: EamA family transporter [Tabrizicola sp.]|nr:EamA family transporter [Tabrizicola sp.]